MKQNFVTINGVDYPVIFTLLTLTNFEDIANKGFFEANLNTTNNRRALIMGAVLAADKKTKLTMDELIALEGWDGYMQIKKANDVIMALANDFFPIPEVEPKPEQPAEEKTEEEGVKN